MNVLLLLVALILFVLRAFGVGSGDVDLGWFGLAFLTGSFLLAHLLPAAVRAPGAR